MKLQTNKLISVIYILMYDNDILVDAFDILIQKK